VSRQPFDAVTFDFWETLVRTSGGDTRAVRGRAVIAALGLHDHEVDPVDLETAFDHAFVLFNEAWKDNRQFTGREAASIVLDRLDLRLSAEAHAAGVDAFLEAGDSLEMELTDHLEETLVALKEREIRLGIICDVGLTPSPVLRGYLAAHGVLDLFDHWSFSDEVGTYKPARRIFDHALDGLGGVDPERAAHVGDLRRTDVAGARAVGMTTVRYRGANDDPAGADDVEADHVIDDHADLLDALGLS
jgi:putative hydrolase of the HAD superfamily